MNVETPILSFLFIPVSSLSCSHLSLALSSLSLKLKTPPSKPLPPFPHLRRATTTDTPPPLSPRNTHHSSLIPMLHQTNHHTNLRSNPRSPRPTFFSQPLTMTQPRTTSTAPPHPLPNQLHPYVTGPLQPTNTNHQNNVQTPTSAAPLSPLPHSPTKPTHSQNPTTATKTSTSPLPLLKISSHQQLHHRASSSTTAAALHCAIINYFKLLWV